MTQQRKPPNAGMGRIKGVPNRATVNARWAIAAFVKNNEERLARLLDKIEKTEGARAAWECVMRLIEHHMPKKPGYVSSQEEPGLAVSLNRPSQQIADN
jgi:hypothetical protein